MNVSRMQGVFFSEIQVLHARFGFGIRFSLFSADFGGARLFLMSKSHSSRYFASDGQILVSGALDQTKKIRKTAADIFAKSGPDKPEKNKEKSKLSPDFSVIFLWI